MRFIQIIAGAALVAGAATTTPAKAQYLGVGVSAGAHISVGGFVGPWGNPGYYAQNYYPYSRQVIYHQPYAGVYYGAPPRLVKKKRHYYAYDHPPRQYYVTGYHGHGPGGYGYYTGYHW